MYLITSCSAPGHFLPHNFLLLLSSPLPEQSLQPFRFLLLLRPHIDHQTFLLGLADLLNTVKAARCENWVFPERHWTEQSDRQTLVSGALEYIWQPACLPKAKQQTKYCKDIKYLEMCHTRTVVGHNSGSVCVEHPVKGLIGLIQ